MAGTVASSATTDTVHAVPVDTCVVAQASQTVKAKRLDRLFSLQKLENRQSLSAVQMFLHFFVAESQINKPQDTFLGALQFLLSLQTDVSC